MLPENIELQVVTPERHILQETVQAVEMPGKEGYLGILPGHAPLITELGIGILAYRKDGRTRYLTVIHGYAEVLPDRVTILAQNAIKPEEIDTSAAQKQLEGGQKLWSEAGEDPAKYEQANEVIHEAEAKLASGDKG